MGFVQHDHVVEAFTADRADHALDEWVLPWRAGRGFDFLDAHRLDRVANFALAS